MTRLQLLLVDCCLMLAVALLINRDKLPLWMQPSHAGQITISVHQHEIVQGMRPVPYKFEGYDTLLAGDSIVWVHPWRADQISFPAMTPKHLLREMRKLLPGKHYALIIIWTGTVLVTDKNLDIRERYIEPTVQMVHLAHAHADRVVVINPMPILGRHAGFSMGNAVNNIDAAARLPRRALHALRARLPDEQIVDTEPFIRAVLAKGKFSAYSGDGVHLTDSGFDAFREYLMQQSQPVALYPREVVERPPPGATAKLMRPGALVPVT